MSTITIAILAFFFIISQGCHSSSTLKPIGTTSLEAYKIGNKWYQPIIQTKGFQEQGIASWYGKEFHGKRTASGEIYDMYKITAAHKTLPLGTWVLVKNLDNGKSIKVRINDRGPFAKNRIIDLSYSAARKIQMIENGIGEVQIIALGKKRTTKSGYKYTHSEHQDTKLTIQIGAFSKKEGAEKIKKQIAPLNTWETSISPMKLNKINIYRVHVGKFESLPEAIECKKILSKNGFTDAFITQG